MNTTMENRTMGRNKGPRIELSLVAQTAEDLEGMLAIIDDRANRDREAASMAQTIDALQATNLKLGSQNERQRHDLEHVRRQLADMAASQAGWAAWQGIAQRAEERAGEIQQSREHDSVIIANLREEAGELRAELDRVRDQLERVQAHYKTAGGGGGSSTGSR